MMKFETECIIQEVVFDFIKSNSSDLLFQKDIYFRELVAEYLYFYISISGYNQKINNLVLAPPLLIRNLKEQISKDFFSKFTQVSNENYFKIKPPIQVDDITNNHPWYNLLKQYTNCVLIYIIDQSQLRNLIPFIRSINHQVILLTEYDVDEDTDLPDNVHVLELDFSLEVVYKNDFLEINFPILYHYINTFEQLMQLLSPKVVFFWEGSFFQQIAFGTVIKKHKTLSICIQDNVLNNKLLNCDQFLIYNCHIILYKHESIEKNILWCNNYNLVLKQIEQFVLLSETRILFLISHMDTTEIRLIIYKLYTKAKELLPKCSIEILDNSNILKKDSFIKSDNRSYSTHHNEFKNNFIILTSDITYPVIENILFENQ